MAKEVLVSQERLGAMELVNRLPSSSDVSAVDCFFSFL